MGDEVGLGEGGLGAGGGVFEDGGVGGEFCVADQDDLVGFFAVGLFHLGLEGASGEVEVGGDSGGAELVGEVKDGGSGGVGLGDEEDGEGSGGGEGDGLCLEGDEEAFEAGAEADAGAGLAAEGFHQVVVSPAAADRGLCPEAAGGDFPEGVGVVVEAADEGSVYGEGDACGTELGLDGVEVGFGLVRKCVDGGGGALEGLLVAGVLGVEDAQGIFGEPALGVLGEGGGDGPEERDEQVAVAGLGVAVAEGVDAEGEVFEPAAAVEVELQEDALDVLLRRGDAEGFGAELVVDAEPAFLGPFVAEVGADVIDLLARALIGEKVVLDHGADDAGGALGAEGHGLAATVVEGEGFLADDVGGFAGPALEELGVFEDGGSDFAVVEDAGGLASGGFDGVPAPGAVGEDVFAAFGGVDPGHVGAGLRTPPRRDCGAGRDLGMNVGCTGRGLLGGVRFGSVLADGGFLDLGFVEDGVEGLLLAELQVEVAERAVLGHGLLELFGAFAAEGGHHGDAAVEFGFVDFDLTVGGDLLEHEEQLELGTGLVDGALPEGVDVGFELGLGHAALHEADGPALHHAVGLALGHLERQFDGGVVEEVLADLVPHGLGDVMVDAFDELLAEGVAELLLVAEAQGLEEVLVDDGGFETFDVVDLDLDLDFLAGDFGLGEVGRHVDVEGSGFAGLDADELGLEFGDFDSGDAAVGDDELGAVLVADDVAVELEVEVADEEVLGLGGVLHGDELALLVAEVLHGLIDVGFGDFDLGLLDLDAVEVGEGEGGLDLDGEGELEVARFGEGFEDLDVLELGLTDDLEVVGGDGVFVALADELPADLIADFGGESLFDEVEGGLAGPEAGDDGLGADLFELLGELFVDAGAGDLDGDFLGGGACVFDRDGVGEGLGGSIGNGGGGVGHGWTRRG